MIPSWNFQQSNMSLGLICNYGSSSSDEDDQNDDDQPELMDFEEYNTEHDDNIDQIVLDVVNSLLAKVDQHLEKKYHFSTSRYRTQSLGDTDSETDSSSSSDSEVWSFHDSDDYDDDDDDEEFNLHTTSNSNNNRQQNQRKTNSCVTKGELTLDDLPPIEKLQISVDVRDLTQVGIVCSILDKLMVIQSFKNVPVLDLDTVLFSKEGSAIGQVFDVIGPVKQPNYVLRFNSQAEIADAKLEMNSPVYYAEGHQQPITKYVFVNQLQKERGSDASWKHNNEPPPEELDYSDDEVERAEKKRREKRKR